jgi:putative hydrolase of the HAD superfamily
MKKDFDHSRQAWERIVDNTFEGLLEPRPSESFFPLLYDRFASPASWKIFDDVLPALDEFAVREIPLAIISNWDERLRPLLRALKLNGYFDTILISSEVYFAKPSNVIFEHAIRSLGVPAESILHIGDSVDEDLHGARESGLQSVLLNRASGTYPSQISSLVQVTQLLDRPDFGPGD